MTGPKPTEKAKSPFYRRLAAKVGTAALIGYGPSRDTYATENPGERFAQTFRNAMRFARANDTTGLGQANDSLPGTTAMHEYIRRKFLP